MRDRRMTFAMLAIVVLALLLAIFGPSMTDKKVNAPQYPATGPEVRQISAKGTVESSEEILLSSQIKGIVNKVYVSAGDPIQEGQLLLEFDRRKIEAQLLQAKAAVAVAEARLAEVNAGFRREEVDMARHSRQRFDTVYREAKDEYERLNRLLTKDAVTQVEVQRAREQLDIAEAQLKEADANLKKHQSGSRLDEIRLAEAAYDRAAADQKYVESLATDYLIYAPISGVVAKRHRDKGESTDIETPLFKLINPALARIRAELEETEAGKVKLGQPAEIIVDAYPGKTFTAVVTKVFPVVQKKTQKSFDPMATFDINTQEIHLKAEDSSLLKNGMTVTVRFK